MRQIGSRAFKRSTYRIRLFQPYASSLVVYVHVFVCVYMLVCVCQIAYVFWLLSHASLLIMIAYYSTLICEFWKEKGLLLILHQPGLVSPSL